MEYLSGMKALNIPCKLNTSGDWHLWCFNWDKNELLNSSDSIFHEYGIEKNKKLPNGEVLNVANHIRACIDMIANSEFNLAQGMRHDFICTEEYDDEVFNLVLRLKDNSNWQEIDKFMGKEYKMKWLNFKGSDINE